MIKSIHRRRLPGVLPSSNPFAGGVTGVRPSRWVFAPLHELPVAAEVTRRISLIASSASLPRRLRAERILFASFRTILLFVICLGFVTTNVLSQPATFFTAVQGTGTISKSPDKATYNAGDSVTLTAAPGRYYAFKQWSDGVLGTNRTVTIGANNSFTAIFTNTVPLETQVLKAWDKALEVHLKTLISMSSNPRVTVVIFWEARPSPASAGTRPAPDLEVVIIG